MNQDFEFFKAIANNIKDDHVQNNSMWVDSPFEWVTKLPAATKGRIGKLMVSTWCASKGLSIGTPTDSDADLLVNGHRVEIKFSTLWKNGQYCFQQIRDQDYEYLVALGISPHDVHCWVISKKILYTNVIGHLPQHTGAGGTETFWFKPKPNNPPEWLKECGGTLTSAYKLLKKSKKK